MASIPGPSERPYQYKMFVVPCWSCGGGKEPPIPLPAGSDDPSRSRCYACKGNGVASIVFRLPATTTSD